VGKHKLAAEMLQKILNGLLATGDQEVHELAHACMGVGDYKKALEYALQEYKKRPGNIEVNETLAKVYYASGEFLKAKTFIDTALKTNCKNPELLCQAGLIYYQLGLKKEAKAFLKGGLERKPYLPYDLEKAAAEVYLKLIKKPGI
jgi:tetratricopeptide (TPR) repeat protein